MSRHNDEHRSCEAITTSGGPFRTSEGPLRTSQHESSSLSHSVLSDTDSGVADTEDVAGRSHPTTSRSRNIGARPRTSTHATSQTASTASTSSSNVDLQTLRDPSHYEELNVIGNGAYGTVYRARDKSTDTIVALKKMRFSLTEDGVPMAILREISLLKQLEKFDHPNIVRLLDICHGQRREREMSLYLVFEHVHQDLASYLEKCPPPGLPQDRIKYIIWQILSGVDFLHSHRIVHRDLKPQNLLVTKEDVVKLTDFGLARIYEFYTLLTSVVVTLWYRSPEVLMGLSYATPVDIWSCGCIFAELFLRKSLFPGQYEMDQLSKIFEVIGTPSEEEWPEKAALSRSNFNQFPTKSWTDLVPEMDPQAQDLVQKMLCFNPSDRITASDALLHPYFSEHGYAPLSFSPSSSSRSTSMRSSDASSSFNSSALSFTSHDDSGASLGDMSGSSGPQT
jgi:serine/threonine protein kinase